VAGALLLALGLLAWVLLPRFMICLPAGLRWAVRSGCWVTASHALGVPPPGQLYWHIDRFADRAAADAARGPGGTVVESYGKVWLFTIAPDGLPPTPGERVATIGPLRIEPDRAYTAKYMEGTFSPGMRSIAHRHPGPEAFYNLDGQFCLETPGRRILVGPGEGVFVPGGIPMQLTATGTTVRRSLVLILHPSDRLPGAPTFSWNPEGLCGASPEATR